MLALLITGSMASALEPLPSEQKVETQNKSVVSSEVKPKPAETVVQPVETAKVSAEPTNPPAPVETVPVPPPTPTPPPAPTTPREWVAAAGIDSSNFWAIDYIFQKESRWCPTRWQGDYSECTFTYTEPYPGAETDPNEGYGLCQSTPAIKMATAGSDWRTNPVTQMKWCDMHAKDRHGGWYQSYNYWIAHRNW